MLLKIKQLPDGRNIELHRYLFNWRMKLSVGDYDGDLHDYDIEGEWCFHDLVKAVNALETWDGQGNPPGWYRNAYTQEYNPEEGIHDGDTNE